MTRELELTLRTILMRDPELEPVRIDRAINFLNDRLSHDPAEMEVVRFQDAMALLGVGKRTIMKYVKTGRLRPIYGCGSRAIGVSRKSIMALTSPHVSRKAAHT